MHGVFPGRLPKNKLQIDKNRNKENNWFQSGSFEIVLILNYSGLLPYKQEKIIKKL
jgi:hypothetical protein